MRIRFIDNYEQYTKGTVVNIPQNKAKLLIGRGIAVISKDITSYDLKVK